MLAHATFVHMVVALALSANGAGMPVLKANSDTVTIRVDRHAVTDAWRLAPEAAPDVYTVDIVDGRAVTVSFITDIDSTDFHVALGDTCDFIIRWEGRDCWTRVVGRAFVPAANFDDEYRKTHRGKIFVSVPEVYEMVNVAIALTPFGRDNPNFIFQKSDYYTAVIDRFDPFSDHEFVQKLQALLGRNSGHYAPLKMNGFAFEFDGGGRIVSRREFDRTGFPSDRENRLRPFLPLMQAFADDTGFRDFYREHHDLYDREVACFHDSLDVDGMQRWLDGNFPSGGGYDTYDVVFSPLVSYNQSSTWFESNGFRELQPHVNFPYARDVQWLAPLSEGALLVYRGNIVFTELNHGYINPAGDRYSDQIGEAISNRDAWVTGDHGANYYRGNSLFFEYLNWGLVSLRIIDLVPAEEQDKLIAAVEGSMTGGRGFIRFAEFDQFLLDLYRNREQGETLEDLYPPMIAWFAERN